MDRRETSPASKPAGKALRLVIQDRAEFVGEHTEATTGVPEDDVGDSVEAS